MRKRCLYHGKKVLYQWVLSSLVQKLNVDIDYHHDCNVLSSVLENPKNLSFESDLIPFNLRCFQNLIHVFADKVTTSFFFHWFPMVHMKLIPKHRNNIISTEIHKDKYIIHDVLKNSRGFGLLCLILAWKNIAPTFFRLFLDSLLHFPRKILRFLLHWYVERN